MTSVGLQATSRGIEGTQERGVGGADTGGALTRGAQHPATLRGAPC